MTRRLRCARGHRWQPTDDNTDDQDRCPTCRGKPIDPSSAGAIQTGRGKPTPPSAEGLTESTARHGHKPTSAQPRSARRRSRDKIDAAGRAGGSASFVALVLLAVLAPLAIIGFIVGMALWARQPAGSSESQAESKTQTGPIVRTQAGRAGGKPVTVTILSDNLGEVTAFTSKPIRSRDAGAGASGITAGCPTTGPGARSRVTGSTCSPLRG